MHCNDTAAIAQLGERQTEDLKVPGSIPGLGISGWSQRRCCELDAEKDRCCWGRPWCRTGNINSSRGPDVDLDLLLGEGAAGATPPLTIADHRLDLRVQLRAE